MALDYAVEYRKDCEAFSCFTADELAKMAQMEPVQVAFLAAMEAEKADSLVVRIEMDVVMRRILIQTIEAKLQQMAAITKKMPDYIRDCDAMVDELAEHYGQAENRLMDYMMKGA